MQELKLVAPSLSTDDDVCMIVFCDGTEATVTGEGAYSVNIDFDWIISGGGGSSSSGGGTSGDGSGSSSCPPPFVCGNPGQAPDQGDSQEEEEQNQIIPQPCEGDPVPNPEIAPTGLQGTDGGRFEAARADGTPHRGLDIKSPIGAPLFSMFDGTIYASNTNGTGTFGNYIIVNSLVNGESILVLYAHLSSVQSTSGSVTSGTIIGNTGDSGNASGTVPHVHIEVKNKAEVELLGYNDATPKNPEDYMTTKFDENGNPIQNSCSS